MSFVVKKERKSNPNSVPRLREMKRLKNQNESFEVEKKITRKADIFMVRLNCYEYTRLCVIFFLSQNSHSDL